MQMSTKLLPELKSECEAEIRVQLSEVNAVAISFDLWLPNKSTGEDVFALNAHYITPDWTLQHKHLGLLTASLPKKDVRMSNKAHSLLRRFELFDKVFAATSDGADDERSGAAAELQRLRDNAPSCACLGQATMYHTACLAHLVNAACNEAVSRVRDFSFKVSRPYFLSPSFLLSLCLCLSCVLHLVRYGLAPCRPSVWRLSP
jgi:hypothetical protein